MFPQLEGQQDVEGEVQQAYRRHGHPHGQDTGEQRYRHQSRTEAGHGLRESGHEKGEADDAKKTECHRFPRTAVSRTLHEGLTTGRRSLAGIATNCNQDGISKGEAH